MAMTPRLRAPAMTPSFALVAGGTVTAALLMALVTSAPADTLIANGLVLLAAMTATGLFAWAARDRTYRSVWLFLAAAGLAFTLAETYWFVVEGLLQQEVQAISIADLGYLVGYALLLAAGVASLPDRTGWSTRARLILDALTVSISLSMIGWVLLVYGSTTTGTEPTGANVLLQGYPVLDIMLLGFLLFMLKTVRPVHRPRVLLFMVGVALWTVVDIIYAARATAAVFTSGAPVDALWVGGYIAFGLAAIVRPSDTPSDWIGAPIDARRWAEVVYVPVFIMLPVVVFGYLQSGGVDEVLFTHGIALVMILAARPILRGQELSAASQQLAQEMAWLNETPARANLGFWMWDMSDDTIWWSKGMHRIFERPSDLGPLRFDEAVRMSNETLQQKTLDAIGRIAKEGGSYDDDIELRLPDGQTKTLSIHVQCVLEEGKAVLEGTVQDITERKTADDANRFQARLLDSVGQAVIATDAQGAITYWNSHAEQMYGWTKEEVMGRSVAEVTPTEATKQQAQEILSSLLEGQSWTGEFMVQRKDGSSFPALIHDDPILDDDGRLVGVIGISQDITERKRLEVDLGERVKELRALSHLAQEGATATAPEDVLTTAVTSLEPAFLHGDTWVSALVGDEVATSDGACPDGPSLASDFAVGPDTGRIEVWYRQTHEDQDIGPFLDEEQDLLDAMAEHMALLIGRMRSVTDIRFRAHLLASVSQAVVATDLAGVVTYWNPAAEGLFGWSSSEAVGRPITDIWGAEQTLDRSVKDDGRPAGDYRLHRKDGTLILARLATNPLLDTDGTLEGFISVLEDVTEQRAVEQRFQDVVETSPAGIYRTSRDGRILLANPEYARIAGYASVKELMAGVDTTRSLYADPSERDRILQLLDEQGEVTGYEFQVRRKDNTTRWARATVRLETTPKGEQVFTGFVEDIEEERRIQRRFQDLVENSPIAIFRTTPEGEFEYVNPAGAQMFGYDDPLQFMAEVGPVENMYADPSDRKILLAEIIKDHPKPLEFQFRRRDGTTFWGEARVTAQTGEDGRQVIEGTLRDLTTEREQHASNSLLAAIVRSSHEALYSKDLDGVIQTWNRGAVELYGFTADEAIGKRVEDLIIPEERMAQYQAFKDRLRHGRAIERHDNVRQRKDGSRVEVSLTLTPLPGPEGKVIGASVSAYDISERKAAEAAEKVRQEGERLQEVDRRLREFINAAAHDLSQPLTPMRMAMFTLERSASSLGEGARKQIDMVNRNVDRMQLLVQDLLDVARLEAGTLNLSLETVHVDRLLQESKEFFANVAETQGITLRSEGENLEVVADPRRIIQVLFNLVGNAMKYTPEGGTVTLTARRLEDKEHACIEVADTGAGMTDEQMSRLFQPFSQVHTDMPNAPKGTGLGLYICKGIITQHEGKIGVHSDGPGKGSMFWFTLPLLDPNGANGKPDKEEE